MAQAVQVARPIADVSVTGWSPTPVYPEVNALNSPPPDYPFVSSDLLAGGTFEVKLNGIALPGNGPQQLIVRFCQTSAAAALVNFTLLQDSQVIASSSVSPTTVFTSYTLLLTPAQVAAITDYTKLRVRVAVSNPGGGCCPSAELPQTLHVTFTGALTGSFPLFFAGSGWSNASVVVCSGLRSSLLLQCIGGKWFFTVSVVDPGGCFTPVTQASTVSCSPLSIAFNMQGAGPGCCFGQNWTATVTP
jgi:hypothetical protein